MHPFGGAFFSVSPKRPDIRVFLVRNLNLRTLISGSGGESESISSPIPIGRTPDSIRKRLKTFSFLLPLGVRARGERQLADKRG